MGEKKKQHVQPPDEKSRGAAAVPRLRLDALPPSPAGTRFKRHILAFISERRQASPLLIQLGICFLFIKARRQLMRQPHYGLVSINCGAKQEQHVETLGGEKSG